MFYHNKLEFGTNQVLKAELLQESADYAQEMLGHIYQAYSNGILAGTEVEIEENHIVVNPGIIKQNNMLYHMSHKVRIPYEHTGQQTILKMRFSDANHQDEKTLYATEFILTEAEEMFPYEMELGRFLSQKGAVLSAEADCFEKLLTQYNHFDIRNVPYAGIGESTLSPKITTLFAKELLSKNTENVYDVAFAMQCLSQKPIERGAIYLYLMKRLSGAYEEMSNEKICQRFLQILKQNPSGRQAMTSVNRRMIVD